MKKIIKVLILICLFRANLMAFQATDCLDLKKLTMIAVATGAGYFSWRIVCKNFEKQAKKKLNKAAIEQEIVERVKEITGQDYQLTAKDQEIINSHKLKLVVFRSARENFTLLNQQNPKNAVLKKPSGLMISDHDQNFQVWHNFGPNFNHLTAKNVPAYTRTFDQNYEDICYSSFAQPELTVLISSQVSEQKAKQFALPICSANSVFCKFKKIESKKLQ